jgi:hypothetical protein
MFGFTSNPPRGKGAGRTRGPIHQECIAECIPAGGKTRNAPLMHSAHSSCVISSRDVGGLAPEGPEGRECSARLGLALG